MIDSYRVVSPICSGFLPVGNHKPLGLESGEQGCAYCSVNGFSCVVGKSIGKVVMYAV